MTASVHGRIWRRLDLAGWAYQVIERSRPGQPERLLMADTHTSQQRALNECCAHIRLVAQMAADRMVTPMTPDNTPTATDVDAGRQAPQ